MKRHPGDRTRRGSARDAFLAAEGPEPPDLRSLAAAVPGMMTEAGRRRAAGAGRRTEIAALIPIARLAIPRLAAVAAVAVIAAVVLAFRDASSVRESRADLEGVILRGASGDTPANPLLDAMTAGRKSDG